MVRSGLVVAVLLLCHCGGRSVTEPEPPNPCASSPAADGPCPPSHDLIGDECVVREIYFPGGTFTMGRGYCPEAGLLKYPPEFDCPLADPPHTVTVKPFYVEATVRTRGKSWSLPANSEPDEFLPSLGGGVRFLGGAESVVAQTCRFSGKRALTETEWEFIATGGGTRIYPWGDAEPTCDCGNIDAEQCPPRNPSTTDNVSRVASYAPTPEGVYDLAGNPAEGVVASPDAYTDGYTTPPTKLPDCPGPYSCCTGWCSGSRLILVRGGSAAGPSTHHRSAWRGVQAVRDGEANELFGDGDLIAFRCARSAE